MVKKTPIISVVVPVYNEEKSLEKCLKSLVKQNINQEDYEIIVVDNASTDNSPKIAKTFPVRIAKENKKGYVYALTKGVEVSKGKFIAFTDADTQVPKNWLKQILTLFNNNPKALAVGGIATYTGRKLFVNSLMKVFNRFTIYLTGPNMAVRKSALEEIGGFDTRVNLSADFYLTLQLRRKGLVITDRSLIVKTSPRRWESPIELALYFLNVMSLFIFGKPIKFSFKDIR